MREARLEDAAELARLAAEMGYPASAETMQTRLRSLLPSPRHRIVVAQRECLPGWIAMERRYALDSGECSAIVGLMVDAAARGNGVGRMLVTEAETGASEQGFGAIDVRPNVACDASHPFYENLGYSRIKTPPTCRKTLK